MSYIHALDMTLCVVHVKGLVMVEKVRQLRIE